jgi:hypothetical protein
VKGDEYKNEEVYVTYPIADYVVTDQALRITDYASRNMSHMKDKTVCIKLFCKQKPLLKIAYAIFCFAKRNISLVKLSFLKKGLL